MNSLLLRYKEVKRFKKDDEILHPFSVILSQRDFRSCEKLAFHYSDRHNRLNMPWFNVYSINEHR